MIHYRTTIGIAEKVDCWIDPDTWADTDCNVTQKKLEEDTIGTVNWSAIGSGGSVSPTTGNNTVLTASKTPAGVTVRATVHDSETKYTDTPVVKNKAFIVIAPSHQTYSLDSDTPPWTPWSSGTKSLGARSMFNVTVQPTTVSFVNADLQEAFGSGMTDTWPDGSTYYGPTGSYRFVINASNQWDPDDTNMTGLYNISKLYTGSQWLDFDVDIPMPLQYKNASATWVTFYTPTATRNYYYSDGTTIVGSGGVTGGTQGPWQP